MHGLTNMKYVSHNKGMQSMSVNTSPKHAVAKYLGDCVARSGKTQLEIAEEAGFPAAHVISMMKGGHLKVPLNRIPALAKALGVDPKEMFARCLEAYEPELFEVYASLAPAMLVSARELRLLRMLRRGALATYGTASGP
jgi:hypothetical protein